MRAAAFVTCVLALCAPGAAVAAPCYVAFVHGSGEKLHDIDPEDPGALESYWTPDGTTYNSFTHYAGRQWAGSGSCVIWRVGYDGFQQWWSDRAAGRVAASLAEFITRENIPDGRLVVVGHSMGGVVARYVVNNGVPGSPYYNEYAWMDARMDYDLVRRKTASVISVQSPHTGSQGADALYGDADHVLTNASAGVVTLLGFHEASNATSVLTRAYMEAAGANGGEMGDEGRAIPLYTIAGTSTGEGSGNGMSDDGKLAQAWVLLCYERGAANSWGAACRWDVWNFSATPGDGLVEQASGHGRWMRGNVNGSSSGGIAGARVTWLDVQHNHNHSRFDDLVANIADRRAGTNQRWYLGSYIGDHLLALPSGE